MPRETNALDHGDRSGLLVELTELCSDADAHDDPLRVFLALPAHSAALGTSKLIIRGERGAGKTALFHVLRALDRQGIDLGEIFPGVTDLSARWVEGFSEQGKAHPSTAVLDQLGAASPVDARLRAFWFGHLIGVLSEALPELGPPPGTFIEAWREHKTAPAAWVDRVGAELGLMSAWLDRLDDRCVADEQWVFVSYDHLDKIGIVQPRVRARFASTLLAMWLSLSNRYDRLRSKIFLREDLFQTSLRGSADSSKLETRSISLRWSTEDLYRVLIRHLAAKPKLREWLSAGPASIPLTQHAAFGWMPPDALPEEGGSCSQRLLAGKLSGELMGVGVKKGYTHRWIPSHLQDAHGSIVPRSIVNLLAFAAQIALQKGPRAQRTRLLHPTELQAALEKTSQHRVAELAEEHPVVSRLENLRGLVLLATRAMLVQRLADPAPGVDDGLERDGDAAFEEFVRLGVLKVRRDRRIDVPDIYRYGYGIKRKGGVARPR